MLRKAISSGWGPAVYFSNPAEKMPIRHFQHTIFHTAYDKIESINMESYCPANPWTVTWEAPRNLHEMFDITSEEVLRYIPDYKINLIAPEELSDAESERFQTELCELLKFIKYSKDKKRLEEIRRHSFQQYECENSTGDQCSYRYRKRSGRLYLSVYEKIV